MAAAPALGNAPSYPRENPSRQGGDPGDSTGTTGVREGMGPCPTTAARGRAPTLLAASNEFLAALASRAMALCLCNGRSRQN